MRLTVVSPSVIVRIAMSATHGTGNGLAPPRIQIFTGR
jgi:hypothetical protein